MGVFFFKTSDSIFFVAIVRRRNHSANTQNCGLLLELLIEMYGNPRTTCRLVQVPACTLDLRFTLVFEGWRSSKTYRNPRSTRRFWVGWGLSDEIKDATYLLSRQTGAQCVRGVGAPSAIIFKRIKERIFIFLSIYLYHNNRAPIRAREHCRRSACNVIVNLNKGG